MADGMGNETGGGAANGGTGGSPLGIALQVLGAFAGISALAALVGGVLVAALIRKWGSRERQILAAPAGPAINATDQELAALDAAVRDDS